MCFWLSRPFVIPSSGRRRQEGEGMRGTRRGRQSAPTFLLLNDFALLQACALSGKKRDIDRLCHHPIAMLVRMQMVAVVRNGLQACGVDAVPQRSVEVDDAV